MKGMDSRQHRRECGGHHGGMKMKFRIGNVVYDAPDHETAYRLGCCWYSPRNKIPVENTETGETKIFSRKLDSAGNLLEVIKND